MNKKYLYMAFFLPFLVRLIFVLTLKDLIFPDEETYLRMALCVKEGKGLCYPHLTASMPPLLPILYAFTISLPFNNLMEIRILHALVGGFLGIFLFVWGNKLFNLRTAIISLLIYSFYPTLVFFTGLILSETIFTFLLFLYLYSIWQFYKEVKWKWGIISGILGALASLVRASALSLFPFLYPLLLYFFIKEKKNPKILFISILIFGLVYSPWIIRNWLRFHHLIITTTDGGWVLYSGNNPKNRTGGGIMGVDVDFPEEAKGMNEIEKDRYFKRKALEFIKTHPSKFFILAFKKFARTWRLYPSPTSGFMSKKYILIMILSYGVLLPFFLWGFFYHLKDFRFLFPLYLPLLIFTLTHMIFIGSIRYRIPLLPYFILLASSSLDLFIKKKFIY